MRKTNTRRSFLTKFLSAASAAFAARSASAGLVTPRAFEGPFYPEPSMRKADTDNDLVKVDNIVTEAGGEILILKGSVLNTEGTPQEGVRVEIWQCDMNGKYLHPGDNRNVSYDEGFQGFGYDITDSDGRYTFRTIKPGKYPGRTPHIHVKVLKGSEHLLTTQFYESANSANTSDGLFNRMSKEQAELVTMKYSTGAESVETIVNIVI